MKKARQVAGFCFDQTRSGRRVGLALHPALIRIAGLPGVGLRGVVLVAGLGLRIAAIVAGPGIGGGGSVLLAHAREPQFPSSNTTSRFADSAVSPGEIAVSASALPRAIAIIGIGTGGR